MKGVQDLVNQCLLNEKPDCVGIMITKDGFVIFEDNDTLEIAEKYFERVKRAIKQDESKDE